MGHRKRCCKRQFCVNPKEVHYITTQDFCRERRLGKTYKIRKPGRYELAEDIKFNPCRNKRSAIVINSDNVILDLCGHTLSNVSKLSQITGITVLTGHENITILGSYGAIKNFTQLGIYIQGGNKKIVLGDDTQLTISGCGYGTPIAFVDGDEPLIQGGLQLGDSEFLALPTPPIPPNPAIPPLSPFHGLLSEVRVNNLTICENANGISMGEGDNYTFRGCSVSNNFEFRKILAGLGVGFFLPDSVVCFGLAYFSNPNLSPPPNFGIKNALFEDCKFNSNVADASRENHPNAYCDSFIMAVNFDNLKVKNCQFNSNDTILGENGNFNQTRGLVLGSGSGTVVEDSEFSNNKGGFFVDGFNLSGLIESDAPQPNLFPANSVTLRNCVASGNVGTPQNAQLSTVDVVGFVLRYPSGVTMIDCVAENNRVKLTPDEAEFVVAFADGILIFSQGEEYPDTTSNSIDIRGAKLSRNRLINGFAGCSSGVRILDGLCENIVIRDSVLVNNFPDADEPPPGPDYFSAGVDITGINRSRPSVVSVINSVVETNGIAGVSTTLNETNVQNNKINNNVYGVLIDAVSECNSVLNNTLRNNDVAVYDPSEFSTSLVGDNKAFNNIFGYLVEYSPGVSPPVVFGTLTDYPPLPEVSCANIEIVKEIVVATAR